MGWKYCYVLLLDKVDVPQIIENAKIAGFVDTTETARKLLLWERQQEDEYDRYTEKHQPTPIGGVSPLPEAELKEAQAWYAKWIAAKPKDPEVRKMWEEDHKQLDDGPIQYDVWLRKIAGAITVWWTGPYFDVKGSFALPMFEVLLLAKYHGRVWWVQGQSVSDQVSITKFRFTNDGKVRRYKSTESGECLYETYLKNNQPTWDIHQLIRKWDLRLPIEEWAMMNITKTVRIERKKFKQPSVTSSETTGKLCREDKQ